MTSTNTTTDQILSTNQAMMIYVARRIARMIKAGNTQQGKFDYDQHARGMNDAERYLFDGEIAKEMMKG